MSESAPTPPDPQLGDLSMPFAEQIRDVLPEKLRGLRCGYPDDGDGDHGHTSCFFFALAADEIDRLRAVEAAYHAQIRALTSALQGAITRPPEALEDANRLAEALEGMACQNCDDRKCMDCVMRYQHDDCEDSCMDCTPMERVDNPLVARYVARAAALEAHYSGRAVGDVP